VDAVALEESRLDGPVEQLFHELPSELRVTECRVQSSRLLEKARPVASDVGQHARTSARGSRGRVDEAGAARERASSWSAPTSAKRHRITVEPSPSTVDAGDGHLHLATRLPDQGPLRTVARPHAKRV